MKRAWLGLWVLVGMLGLSLWAGSQVAAIHEPLETAVLEAAEAALAGDWTLAEDALRGGAAHWERHRRMAAALTSHAAVEEAEALLDQAALYARLRDPVPFAAACRSLAGLCQAEAEAQRLNWWNLL